MSKRVFRLILLAVILVALGFTLFSFLHRPYDDLVTISRLSSVTASEEYILASVSDGSSDSSEFSYYEIGGSDELSELFSFQDWSVVGTQPTKSPLIIFRFAEGWILELYAEGLAIAHNGYAAACTVSECCYSVPSDLTSELSAYLSAFGQSHHMGDGTISTSTFRW